MTAAAGLVLCIVVLGMIPYVHHLRERRAPDVPDFLDRLSILSAAQERGKEPQLRIVGIGTSLLNSGTFQDREMEVFASKQLGLSVRYVRCARFAQISREWKSLMAAVHKVHPSAVLVEDTFLFHKPVRFPWLRVHYYRYRTFWKKRIKAQLVKSDQERSQFTERDLIRAREFWSQFFQIGLRPGSEEIFETFRTSGIPVYVLQMPIHEEGLLTRSPEDWAAMDKALRDLEADGLVTILRCPLIFEREDYTDLRHLSPSGRAKYSQWLLQAIAEREDP